MAKLLIMVLVGARRRRGYIYGKEGGPELMDSTLYMVNDRTMISIGSVDGFSNNSFAQTSCSISENQGRFCSKEMKDIFGARSDPAAYFSQKKTKLNWCQVRNVLVFRLTAGISLRHTYALESLFPFSIPFCTLCVVMFVCVT